MSESTPEFMTCAMEAIEEGIKAEDIKEECACRLGLSPSIAPFHVTPNP